MKKYIFLLVTGGVLLGSWLGRDERSVFRQTPGVSQEAAAVTERQIEEPVARPVLLRIEKLKVAANIQAVGEDDEGRMAVPDRWTDTAWYRYGARPGEPGKAVIAGHYDQPDGPAVFYWLGELETGDRVQVVGDSGETFLFEVIGKTVYEDRFFPVETVFGKSDRRLLNLVTCEGVYDRADRTYSHRLVVFTELVESNL